MEQLLLQRISKLEADLWPLGKPDNFREAPLWQEICKEWQWSRLQPTHVSHLINELLESSPELDRNGEATIASDIREAVREGANWEEVARQKDWVTCDEMINRLTSPGTDPALLVRLLTLATDDSASEEVIPGDEARFFWVRLNPTWVDGQLEHKPELLSWADMTDTYIQHREVGDIAAEKNTGDAPTYHLCKAWISSRVPHAVAFSDYWAVVGDYVKVRDLDALPDGIFIPMGQLLETCRYAVTAWVISEWLEPHGFVNLGRDEWSSETSWLKLGENYGYEVVEPDVASWYIVNEVPGEHLKELGEVCCPLLGSSNFLYGRTCSGQALYFDGEVQNAMIRSGYLNHVPPLGALNSDERTLPRLRVTLGGEEFPFQIYGYSEIRPDRELDSVILDPVYREAGWGVTWGSSYSSVHEGTIRTFKLGPATAESSVPEWHEG